MFNERGVDPFIGAELYRALGIGPMDERDIQKMEKVTAIAKYLERQPDPLFVIGKIAHNKSQMPNVDFLASYVRIAEQKEGIQEQLAAIDKELSHYE